MTEELKSKLKDMVGNMVVGIWLLVSSLVAFAIVVAEYYGYVEMVPMELIFGAVLGGVLLSVALMLIAAGHCDYIDIKEGLAKEKSTTTH